MKNKEILLSFILIFITFSCSKPRLGKKTVDLNKINFDMDVPYFYSKAADDKLPYQEWTKAVYVYAKDTLRFYNTQTGEHYPNLIQYETRGRLGVIEGEAKEAEFDRFPFENPGMATTLDNRLVLVKAETKLNDKQLEVFKNTLDRKYGLHTKYIEHIIRGNSHIWKWVTPDECGQLVISTPNIGTFLAIDKTGKMLDPVKRTNPAPFIDVNFYVWKYEFNDLVLVHTPLGLSTFDKERDKYYAREVE